MDPTLMDSVDLFLSMIPNEEGLKTSHRELVENKKKIKVCESTLEEEVAANLPAEGRHDANRPP
jgi:hypothetical protein